MSSRARRWLRTVTRLVRAPMVRAPIACAECGERNDPGTARFCGRCGALVGRRASPSAERRDDVPRVRDRTGRVREVVATIALAALLVGVLAGTAWLRRPEPAPLGAAPRGDAGRTGIATTITPGPPDGVAWQVPLGEQVTGIETAVVVLPDTTLVRAGHRLLTYGTTDGELRWVADDPYAAAPIQPVESGDQLVLLDEEGWARGYDRLTGVPRWAEPVARNARLVPAGQGALGIAPGNLVTRYEADGPTWTISTRTVFDADLEAFVGATGDTALFVLSRPPGLGFRPEAEGFQAVLSAIDLADGSLAFERPLSLDELRGGGTFLVPPMAGDTVVLRTAEAGVVRLVDVPSGATRELDLGTIFEPSLMEVEDDELAVWTRADGVSLHDLETGRQRWRTGTGIGAPEDLIVTDDTVALIMEDFARIYDRATGKPITDAPFEAADRWVEAETGAVVTSTRPGSLQGSTIDGVVRWQVELPGQLLPAAALADGEVVVPLRDGVTVRSVADGAQRFAHELAARDADAVTLHTPVIGDETIVVSPDAAGPNDRGLFGLDRQTAVLRWDRSGDQPSPQRTMTVEDGGLAFLGVGDEVHAYDIATGRRAFAAEAGQPRHAVAITAGVVVAVADPLAVRAARGDPRQQDLRRAPSVIGIDRGDRSTRWEAVLDVCSAPAAAETIAAVAESGAVVGIDVIDGQVAWRTELPVWCDDLAVADGRVLAPTIDGLVALGLGDGERQWEVTLAAPIATMPVVAGDLALVGAVDGSLTAYRVEDGAIAWRVQLPDVAAAPPAVGEDRLVVRLRDGTLVALDLP